MDKNDWLREANNLKVHAELLERTLLTQDLTRLDQWEEMFYFYWIKRLAVQVKHILLDITPVDPAHER